VRGFRRTGLTGQSSTLWVMAGFVVLLVIGYCHDNGLKLSGHSNRRKGATMKKAQEALGVLVFGILDAVRAVGASIMADHLSA